MTLPPSPDLSAIIVSWNVVALLRDCLKSVARSQESGGKEQKAAVSADRTAAAQDLLITDSRPLTTETIVIDNASRDDSAAMVDAEFPAIRLIANAENLGFARANNQGIAISQGRYILLLNSDTLVPPGALAGLVAFMDQHTEAGAVCPRLVLPGGEPQAFAFGGDPSIGYLMKRGLYRLLLRRSVHNWRTDQIQAVDWVSGACLLVRRAVIDQVGGLDENIFMYFEDADWCKRIREAGWRVMFNPQIEIVHLGGRSLAQNPAAGEAYDRSLRYFYDKHYGPLARLLLGMFLTVYRAWPSSI